MPAMVVMVMVDELMMSEWRKGCAVSVHHTKKKGCCSYCILGVPSFGDVCIAGSKIVQLNPYWFLCEESSRSKDPIQLSRHFFNKVESRKTTPTSDERAPTPQNSTDRNHESRRTLLHPCPIDNRHSFPHLPCPRHGTSCLGNRRRRSDGTTHLSQTPCETRLRSHWHCPVRGLQTSIVGWNIGHWRTIQ